MFEGECFSFYNLHAKIERRQSFILHYIDLNQQVQSLMMQGEVSGLIQHELDHLDGIFFLDRVEENSSVVSIDYLFKNEPERLVVVKEMCDYMSPLKCVCS